MPDGPRDYELSRMPIIPGFATAFGNKTAVPFDPFQWHGGFVYNAEKGSQRWTLLNDLIGSVVIDNHRELVTAWDRVRKRAPDDPLVRELTRPPFSEKEGRRLAGEEWLKPEQRAKIRALWSAEARKRYSDIAGR